MQREYTTTFLNFTANDIEDFVTIRRRFDRPSQYRSSLNEIIDLIASDERELLIQEEKYLDSIKEQEAIEKEIEEIREAESLNQIIDQTEKCLPFPYQSFLNLRHWRKAPKNLKLFFQALACFFSISSPDFLSALKANHHLLASLEFYQPSPTTMDEFRMKYSDISPESVRNKSFDAYTIAVWMHAIDENERLNRIKQEQLENQKRVENQLNKLHLDCSNKQKEIQLIEQKIKMLKKNLDQTEKHHQILFQSN